MKLRSLLLSAVLALTACTAPTSTNAIVSSLEDPNHEALVLQGTITVVANRVLAKNATYAPEALAFANILVTVANGTETQIAAPDVGTLLADPNLKITTSLHDEIVSDYNTALGLFNATWQLKFPTLKPNYNIFLLAFANGILTAEGKTTVPLPVIPWPPAVVAPAAPVVAPTTS